MFGGAALLNQTTLGLERMPIAFFVHWVVGTIPGADRVKGKNQGPLWFYSNANARGVFIVRSKKAILFFMENGAAFRLAGLLFRGGIGGSTNGPDVGRGRARGFDPRRSQL